MKPAKQVAPIDVAIIDCFYVAYRGFCSTPMLQSKAGVPTNAIHGILGAVRRMVRDLRPKAVIVATESKTNFRYQISADYKAGRQLPELFGQQIPYIYQMCKLLGWHLLDQEGYEADDVIASIARRMTELKLRGVVFSTDKDIISRIGETAGIIGVFRVEKVKSLVMEPADYQAKWGVAPSLKPEVLCLSGDSVDNIPGIRGLGEKTAVKLIQDFGSIAGIYQNLDKLKPKLRALLESPEGKEALELSRKLIQINDALPIADAVFQPGVQQTKELREFFLSLDMVKTAESVAPADLLTQAPSPAPQTETEQNEGSAGEEDLDPVQTGTVASGVA
jgi:DNA polymerase-1